MKDSTTLCHESKDLGQIRKKNNGYRFPEHINNTVFFKFRKDLITAGNSIWRGLPLSTKSIYPVIGCHTNASGVAFPSQQTIADLCGCEAKTVREGIKGLLKIPWVELNTKITSRGSMQKVYTINPPDEKTKSFSFYKSILESGIWRELSIQYKSKAAHAVYCTCLAYAYFDYDLYAEIEPDHEYDLQGFFDPDCDEYARRPYDFLCAELDVIAHKSGISIPTARKAIQALIDNSLLEEIPGMEEQTWKIKRTAPVYYNREYLNECLARKQPEETEFMKCGGLGVYNNINSKAGGKGCKRI